MIEPTSETVIIVIINKLTIKTIVTIDSQITSFLTYSTPSIS